MFSARSQRTGHELFRHAARHDFGQVPSQIDQL